VINVGGRDLIEAWRTQSGAHPDVVIEAVGKPETWQAAVGLVRKGGIVNFFGGCPADIQSRWTPRTCTTRVSRCWRAFTTPRARFARALQLIENGTIRADDFVDGECPLSRLPELFRSMAAGNRAVKTLIKVRQ